MENMLSIKFATYATVTTLLFFSCPDMRSSEAIADGVSTEEFSLHHEYDPDSMNCYYDSSM